MRENKSQLYTIFLIIFLFILSAPAMGQIQKQDERSPRVSMTEKHPDAEKINADFFKIDLHNIFRIIGKVSGKNIVVDESVKGDITLDLHEVPWTLLLDIVAGLKGLDIIENDNTIMIYPLNKKVSWETLSPKHGMNAEDIIEIQEPEIPVVQETISVPQGPSLEMKQVLAIQTPIEEVNKAQELIGKAEELNQKGAIKEALKFYIKASEIWPENTNLSKKIVSLSLGKVNEPLIALNYSKKILSFYPDDPNAPTTAGIALARMGKAEEAKIYFEKAMDRADSPMDSILNYAVFCESIGEYRNTLRLVNMIEKKYEMSPEAMILKAGALEKIGKLEAARKEYLAILQSGASVSPDMLSYAKNRMEQLQGTR